MTARASKKGHIKNALPVRAIADRLRTLKLHSVHRAGAHGQFVADGLLKVGLRGDEQRFRSSKLAGRDGFLVAVNCPPALRQKADYGELWFGRKSREGLRQQADGQITEAQSKLITILAWVVSRDGNT